MDVLHKRLKTMEGSEGDGGGRVETEEEGEVVEEADMVVSEEMEVQVQAILERIQRFTEQVSELLEAGKGMFNNLGAQFEERLISIHREQVEKWQEEIKALRSLDASNESSHGLLQKAQLHLFQSVNEEQS